MPTANEIRQQFIDFFTKKHGHTFVPSSSVVPHDDPTLLFTNAGMNQFKDVFLGTGTRSYKRAANTQKCIRAGGKHNDLDDVGKDTYHHTFFEMLGNWSFGDYFKKEAIAWAWELLTDVWKMDKSRLHVTVFEGDPDNGIPRDEEAAGFWRAVGVDPSHIHLGNKKDNFWEMGETGPCGPCTEVHIDLTLDKSGAKLVNRGTPQVIEIWNLVFIQFNRNADKSLTPLPAKHVDTGMGFERVCAVLQGKNSNYDTDVFAPLFDAIKMAIPNAPGYKNEPVDPLLGQTSLVRGLGDIAYRVIADHIRALTYALSDGARIGNEGRDYVLKRILRRAERYGRQYLNASKPFLCDLVEAVVRTMGHAFPELRKRSEHIASEIKKEEEAFIKTLDRGIRHFQLAYQRRTENTISAEDVFKLHDELGIYVDITEQMAFEGGARVDRQGFDELMMASKDKAREGQRKHVAVAVHGDLPKTDDSPKYASLAAEATILGWVEDNTVVRGGLLLPGRNVGLILDRTCFYAEQGGQVGDAGTITGGTGTFAVETTQKLGDAVLHVGSLSEGMLEVGQTVELAVTPGERLDTMRNHTSTHLLNLALRKVLGEHVEQKGSLVDADKTRFDFGHDKPLSLDQIAQVEQIVNEQITADRPVTPVVMPLAEAKKIAGVRAVFGEKYPDPVRVLLIGPAAPEAATADDSVEFCGGTHLQRTSQAGLFKIVAQEAVGKGVRRLTAVTGRKAFDAVQEMAKVVAELTERFHCSPKELPARVESLQDEVKKLQAQLRKGVSGDLASVADKLLADAPEIGDAKVIVGEMPGGTMEQVRQQTDRLISKAGRCVIVLGWSDEGKVFLRAVVASELTAKVHAGNLIKEIVPIVGGKGGGKPDKAEAGGSQPGKLAEALALARTRIGEMLGQ